MHYRRKQSKSKSRKSRNKKGGGLFGLFDWFNTASSETQSEEKKSSSSWFPSWLTPPSIPAQTAVQIPGRPLQPQPQPQPQPLQPVPQPAQPVPAPPQQPQQMPVPSVGGRRRGKKQQTKTKKCKK